MFRFEAESTQKEISGCTTITRRRSAPQPELGNKADSVFALFREKY